jgi:hypothetical protein
MNRIATLAIGLMLSTGSVIPLFAKGATVKVAVTPHDGSQGVVIDDPAALRPFNVWGGRGVVVNGIEQGGGFIIQWSDGILPDRPRGLKQYEVSFYVEGGELAYVVDYEWDPASGHGYAYLPGHTDRRYALNTRSISRGGLEGDWFHASRSWQELVNPLLAKSSHH